MLSLAAPAQNPLALSAPPFGRPEMPPQALEKPRFAPGNGAPFLAPAETSLLQAGRSRSPLTRQPEMLSQAIENAQNAPGNGMALQVWTPQYLVRGLAEEVPSPLVGSRGEASASQPDSARFASSTQ